MECFHSQNPLQLGYLLVNIVAILRGSALEDGNSHMEKDARDLKSVFETEWSIRVSTRALKTLNDYKQNKATALSRDIGYEES